MGPDLCVPVPVNGVGNRSYICAVLVVMIVLLSGCTLGHDIFKPNTKQLVDSYKKCQDYDKVFLSDEDRVIVSSEYKDLALISNVCVGKETTDGKRMSLAVIEFDDEGNHWDRRQFVNAMNEIDRISEYMEDRESVGVEEGVRTDGIFLVVYVHGWRTNSSENRETLSKFRWYISELADSEQTCYRPQGTSHGPSSVRHPASERSNTECQSRPHVFGVYISWRGDSVGERLRRLPGAEYVTFWDRMAAARRVAGIAMTETLLGLFDTLETADRSRFFSRNPQGDMQLNAVSAPPRSRSLVIGHSMGARILEQAFAQAFLGKRLEARRSYGARLLQVLTEVDDEVKKLNSSETELDDLDKQLVTNAEKSEMLATSIEENNTRVQELQEELLMIPESTDQEEQLLTYAAFRMPPLNQGQRSCATYEQSRVNECVGESNDLRVSAHCVISEVRCLYKSYRCSVERQFKEGESSNCTDRYIDLKVESVDNGEVEYWKEFAEDIGRKVSEVEALLSSYVVNASSLSPPPSMSDILKDDSMFDSSIELVGTIAHWLDHIVPWNFAPVTVFERDSTEDVEDRLINELNAAKNDIETRLKRGKEHLAMMQTARSLHHKQQMKRQRIGNEIKQLGKNMTALEADKENTEDLQKELGEKRKKKATQVNDISEGLQQSVKEVPFELDGALHPPADIVLLLNPATEAISARNLIQAMCLTQGKSKAILEKVKDRWPRLPGLELDHIRQPWIVSITSNKDSATKVLFPLGVRLGRLLNRAANREFDEPSDRCEDDFGAYSDMIALTAGHHERLWSHKIELVQDDGENSGSVVFNIGDRTYVMREISPERGKREYWVAQAPREIIEGHSDVLNKRTLELALGLLTYNGTFVSWCPRYNQQTGECETVEEAAASNRL